jgi:hypothetical protein
MNSLLTKLVLDGACICWLENILRVPIPLIDIEFVSERCFIWITIQTPFGSGHPLFGIVRYAEQRRVKWASHFLQADQSPVCAIYSNLQFGFPKYTELKLSKKAAAHKERLATDSLFARKWRLFLEEAIAESQL